MEEIGKSEAIDGLKNSMALRKKDSSSSHVGI